MTSGASQKISKIPDYAKDFRNEWLFIRGINKKCGEFSKKLDDTTAFEEVFWSLRAKALINHFKNILKNQKLGKLQNIRQLKFKLSAVDKIIELRVDLYYLMGNSFYADFFADEDFQDFFENFIFFTNSVNIKYEKDFEDDLFNIDDFRGTFTVIESESESESDFYIIWDSDSDSDSD